jgi:hypothetical protein
MTPLQESVNKQLQEQAVVCGDFCTAQDLKREIITEFA